MPLKQHNTWAQAAGKGLNNIGNGPTSTSNTEMENEQDNTGNSASKVKRMEENVNESQIAAAFSEGWGQRGINQDTAWEVPSSPHLSPKEGSTWTSTSSGTEIWENNVRHHIKSSTAKPPSQMREPWGHTPSTHIGGTWGEEEDTTNLWTGNNTINPNINPNWGNEPPALQIGLPHLPLTNENKNIAALQIDLSQIASLPSKNKNIAEDSGPDNGPPWGDPSHKPNRTFGNWSPVTGSNKRCHHLVGKKLHPLHQSPVNLVLTMMMELLYGAIPSTKVKCPTGKRCHLPNSYLTVLYLLVTCAKVAIHVPPHGGPGMIRLPQSGSNMNKNDNVWMKNQSMNRNLNWNEVAFGNWGEPGHPMGPYWGAKSKSTSCNWADGQVDTSSWGGPMKQGGKPLSKDLIWASKQFRLLMEMNFKKDDIENALRRTKYES
ncbi:protein Gawky [Caerostris extrusa]|uniref:Protein Gawky n=1 Tax=Caerostris extrusa TaxID=172846 RepID=A0AAV4UDR4_CAEEX|nr:protein Gawky [Caerostris extrusa]